MSDLSFPENTNAPALPGIEPLPPDPAEARQDILNVSPDPQTEDAKMDLSKYLAEKTGMSPVFIHQNFDSVADQFYGKKTPNAVERLGNTIKTEQVGRQIAKLSARQAFGDTSPETQVAIDEQKKLLPDPETTIKGLPGDLIKQIYSFGFELPKEAYTGALTDPKASTVDKVVAGIASVLALSPVGVVPIQGGRIIKDMNEQAIGASYRASIDAGMDPTVARVQAGVSALIFDAMNTLQIGAAAGAGERIAGTAIAKALLSKSVVRLGLEATQQEALAYGMTLANKAVNEAAVEASNQWAGTNLPHEQFLNMLKEAGIEAQPMAIMGTMIAGASTVGGAYRIAKDSALETQVRDTVRNIVTPTTKPLETVPIEPPRPEMTVEQKQTIYDQRMAQARARVEEIKARLATAKPEERLALEADLADLNKTLLTTFGEMPVTWFSEKPGDQNVGDVLHSEDFQLEQPKETPAVPKPAPAVQEKFGFAEMTPGQVKDEAQQMRMFEAPTKNAWDMTGSELGIIYHAGTKKIESVDLSKTQQRDYGFYGKGFYGATKPEYAKGYGNTVSEIKLNPEAKVLNASLKPEKAPAGLVDAVASDYYDRAIEGAKARGKEAFLTEEIKGIRTNPLEWKNAVDSFARKHGYDVVKYSDAEIVLLTGRATQSFEKPKTPEEVIAYLSDKPASQWTKGNQPDYYDILHPSTREGGGWQITNFERATNEPTGHMDYATKEEAIRDMVGAGWGLADVAKEVQTSIVAPETAPRDPLPAVTQFDPNKIPVQEVPLDKITISKDVPNFKEGANAQGIIEPLAGKQYERLGTAPIVVWERTDGRMEVITGRHRYDLAVRSGEKTIPAQVVREADGFTAVQAATFDAESNIRDGQGSVKDYAAYFKANQVTEQEASSRGLLARDKGRKGFAIGQYASDGLYTLYRNDQIGEGKAAAIAAAAPRDEGLQNAGIQRAKELTADELSNYVNILKIQSTTSGVNLDLFGRDDTVMVEAAAVAKEASRKMAGLRDENAALKSALRLSTKERAALVEKYGFKTGDRAAVETRIGELEQQIADWSNWYTDSAKVRELRQQAGLSAEAAPITRTLETATTAPEKAPVKTAAKAETPELPPIKPFVPEAVRPAGNEPMTASDFENFLIHDPSYDRAVAEVRRVEEQIRTKAGSIEDLNAELKSATDRANQVADAVKQDWQHRIAVNRARSDARKSVNRMIQDIAGIQTKGVRMPDEYRKAIEEVKDAFATVRHTQKTLGHLKDIAAALEKDPYFPVNKEDRARLADLGKTPLRDLSVDDLRTIHDAVMMYAKLAQTANKATLRGQVVDRDVAVKTITAEMRPTKGIDENIQSSIPTMAGEFEKSRIKAATFLKDLVNDPDIAINSAFGGEQSNGYEMFQGKILANEEVKAKYNAEYRKPLDDFAAKHNLNLDRWRLEPKSFDLGGGRSVKLTRDEVLEMWQHAQRPDNLADLQAGYGTVNGDHPYHKYTLKPEEIQQIISGLDPKEKELLGILASEYKMRGQEADSVSYDVNGAHLELLADYVPITLLPGNRGEPIEFELAKKEYANRLTRAGVDKGHMQERTGFVGPLMIRGAVDAYLRHADNIATYRSMEKDIRNAGRVLYSKDFQDQVRARSGGDWLLSVMDRNLKDAAGMKEPNRGAAKMVMDLRRKAMTAILFGRLQTAVINSVLQFRGMIYAGFGHGLTGIAENLFNPKGVHDLLMAVNPYYHERSTRGFTREQSDIFASTTPQKILGKVGRAGALPTRILTQWAIAGEMKGAYNRAMAEIKALRTRDTPLSASVGLAMRDETGNILTADQIKAMPAEKLPFLASKFGTYSVERTHASSLPEMQAILSKNPVGAQLTTFQSEFHAALSAVRRSFMEAKYTPNGWWKALRTVAILGALEPTAIWGARTLFAKLLAKRDPKWTDEMITQAIGGLPVARDVVGSGLRMIEYGPSSPAADANTFFLDKYVGDAGRNVYLMDRAFTAASQDSRRKAAWKMVDNMANTTISLTTGVSYQAMRDLVVGVYKTLSGTGPTVKKE
jgi:hypothetical protein